MQMSVHVRHMVRSSCGHVLLARNGDTISFDLKFNAI